MIDRNVLRLGGICGLLFVVLFIPSYVSAPDAPSTTSSIEQVLDYFTAGQSAIVFLNGVLLVFASFFFLWFLGILHALLQHAEHDGYAFGSVTLIGGLLFVALMLAGAAIEIVHPAVRQLSQRCTTGLRVVRALGVDVPLRLCRHGNPHRRRVVRRAANRHLAEVAGLGRLGMRGGGTASFLRPAGRLADAGVDRCRVRAHGRRSGRPTCRPWDSGLMRARAIGGACSTTFGRETLGGMSAGRRRSSLQWGKNS
jgi:hypothetical protein